MENDPKEYNREFFVLFHELSVQLEDYPWYFDINEVISMLDRLRFLANDLKPTKESGKA
jgi:hypothetical protein